jgi:hypothetical protein
MSCLTSGFEHISLLVEEDKWLLDQFMLLMKYTNQIPEDLRQ